MPMTHPSDSNNPSLQIENNQTQPSSAATKPQPSAIATFRALGYSKIPRSAPLLRGKPETAAKALNTSPQLSHLLELARDSQQRLNALQNLLPPQLKNVVKASTLDGDSWCLLVPNNSVMAKLKQMLPSMAAHLRSKGFQVQTIRLKIEGR